MVLFRVITPDQAYAAIDLQILGLLFGTMVVSVYLERADMFKYLGKLLSWKSMGARDLLCRICLVSAFSSAFFTNDTSCVVLTEFVLKTARQQNLPPGPFLLALASSANIGSSATPIGNPQNLVIAVLSKVTFGYFLMGILPAMLVGVCVNALILLCMFWKLLSVQKDEEYPPMETVADEDMVSHRFSPATMTHSQELLPNLEDTSHLDTLRNRIVSSENEVHRDPSGKIESTRNSNASKEVTNDGSLQIKEESIPSRASSICESTYASSFMSSEEKDDTSTRRKRIMWKTCVYLVTVGMLIAFLVGMNMSWTAITAALALVVLDFKDARPSLDKVQSLFLILKGKVSVLAWLR